MTGNTNMALPQSEPPIYLDEISGEVITETPVEAEIRQQGFHAWIAQSRSGFQPVMIQQSHRLADL